MPLHGLKPGQSATITALRCADSARLNRLGAFGLVPGSVIFLRQVYPALVVEVGGTVLSMDHAVADDILVQVP